MKMQTRDGVEVMDLEKIERSGNDLLLRAVVMGAMPMAIVLTPEEARKGLRLMSWRILPFLLTFLFRRSGSRSAQN